MMLNLRIHLIVILVCNLVSCPFIIAQQIPLPVKLSQAHPRLLVDADDWQRMHEAIQKDGPARNEFQRMKESVDLYVDRHQTDSTWMPSRLQMYWKTKSTDVYIRAGVYDHADGQAPVPTPRFPGSRDAVTVYTAPKLDDMTPYDDDPSGILLINRSKPGQPLERAEIAKTGRIIESINANILSMAATSASLYWITQEEKYARFAFDLFNTYLSGMAYRSSPHDITHGHHETIAGLSTFEVIQEVAILRSLTTTYDFLFPYIQKRSPDKIKTYTDVLKRWAEVQINHGVAFNNWNLMELRNILTIATVLDDNNGYADGKGRMYYINYVLNTDSEKQWSLAKILRQGYDPKTALWYECPGYSLGVLGDFTGFVNLFQTRYQDDILPGTPIIKQAVLASAQYLFPNGYVTSFGDSHYRRLPTRPTLDLIANAQQYHKSQQDTIFTRYLKTIQALNREQGGETAGERGTIFSQADPIDSQKDIPAGKIEDYVSPTFYSPNVSYFALRNSMDAQQGLMVALSGSKGNHMHAGGISMEIYGKGVVLGPESGIGTSYFQQDYAEYYSQFPAHNTVAVDGISAYPVMKSNHGFDLAGSYPASGVNKGIFPWISYGDLAFVEPETQADQRRLTAIIRNGDKAAYYVDIFRSRRRDGQDKMHDYFYHNLGQSLVVTDQLGKALAMQTTDKLSFAGGHLFAYDYFWDKKSAVTAQDIQATFSLAIPGREDVQMHMWMKGEPGREIFAVKAPRSRAFGHDVMIPDSIADLPMPTLVARQSGEAWTRPFTVVFEPSTTSEPKTISTITAFTPKGASANFVGLSVEGKDNTKNYIFSSISPETIRHNANTVQAAFAVISYQHNQLSDLFMDKGTLVSAPGYSLKATSPTAAALHIQNGQISLTASKPIILEVPDTYAAGKTVTATYQINSKQTTVIGRRTRVAGKSVVAFALPDMAYTPLLLK